jgi:hypothetical protein
MATCTPPGRGGAGGVLRRASFWRVHPVHNSRFGARVRWRRPSNATITAWAALLSALAALIGAIKGCSPT